MNITTLALDAVPLESIVTLVIVGFVVAIATSKIKDDIKKQKQMQKHLEEIILSANFDYKEAKKRKKDVKNLIYITGLRGDLDRALEESIKCCGYTKKALGLQGTITIEPELLELFIEQMNNNISYFESEKVIYENKLSNLKKEKANPNEIQENIKHLKYINGLLHHYYNLKYYYTKYGF